MGWDKGSLTDQQTKGTVTTTMQKSGIYKTNPQNRIALSDRTAAVPYRATRVFLQRLSPPTGTQHDGTWYGKPCSGWPGWVSPPSYVPSWSPVKINPVLAKPRTGTSSSLWGRRSPGIGCLGRLWSLLLWRYSRHTWTRSLTAYCRWPCFGRRVGLDEPQRSFPTPTILCDSVWFCVIYAHQKSMQCHGLKWSGTVCRITGQIQKRSMNWG